jgi:hypothetical protein
MSGGGHGGDGGVVDGRAGGLGGRAGGLVAKRRKKHRAPCPVLPSFYTAIPGVQFPDFSCSAVASKAFIQSSAVRPPCSAESTHIRPSVRRRKAVRGGEEFSSFWWGEVGSAALIAVILRRSMTPRFSYVYVCMYVYIYMHVYIYIYKCKKEETNTIKVRNKMGRKEEGRAVKEGQEKEGI